MKSHWVVVADAATVRIFEADEMIAKLTLVEEFDHPETKLKAGDLVSGDRGRSRTFQGEHTAFERHTDPHRNEVHAFAKEVGAKLVAAHNAHKFERLVLVAPPVFLGELRPEIGSLGASLVATITKDWTKVAAHDLPGRIHGELPPVAGMPDGI